MKIYLAIGMSRQEFHTSISQVFGHYIALGITDSTNIPNGRFAVKTTLNLFGIFLVDTIKIFADHIFHGGGIRWCGWR